MSWLSKATGIHISPKGVSVSKPDPIGTVKDVGHTVGDIASNPWVQGLTAAALGATGVGAPAAAAILAAEKGGGALLKKGGNIGQAATGAATGAALGAGASKLGSSVDDWLHGMASQNQTGDGGTDWMGIAKGLFSGGGNDGQGNFGEIGDLLGKIPGGVGDLLGKAGSAISGGGSGGNALDTLLTGGAIASAAADKQRSQGFQNDAATYAKTDYDKNSPLRDQARTMLANPSTAPTPDLSSIFSNSENPYDRARRGAPPIGTRVPVASTY